MIPHEYQHKPCLKLTCKQEDCIFKKTVSPKLRNCNMWSGDYEEFVLKPHLAAIQDNSDCSVLSGGILGLSALGFGLLVLTVAAAYVVIEAVMCFFGFLVIGYVGMRFFKM